MGVRFHYKQIFLLCYFWVVTLSAPGLAFAAARINERSCTQTIGSKSSGRISLKRNHLYGVVLTSWQGGDKIVPLAPGPLWRVDLSDGTTLSPQNAARPICRRISQNALRLEWRDGGMLKGWGVTLNVKRTKRGVITWTASVARSLKAGISSVGIREFSAPLLRFNQRSPDTHLILGVQTGAQVRNPIEALTREGPFEQRLTYPQMQTMALNAFVLDGPMSSLALILASYGNSATRFSGKDFIVRAADGMLELAVAQTGSAPYQSRSVRFSEPITISGVQCGRNVPASMCWLPVAHWYRDSLDSLRIPRHPRRPRDFAAFSLLAPNYQNTTVDFADYGRYLTRMANYLGIAPAELPSLWYSWAAAENGSFSYVAQEGFRAAIVAAQDRGFQALPYTGPSGVLLSEVSSSDVNNGIIRDFYGSPHLLWLAPRAYQVDPGVSTLPTRQLTGLYRPIINDVSPRGIYLDVFPWFNRCYAADHGHPIAGGTSYADGARKFVESVEEELGTADALIVTEASAEYLADSLPIFNYYRFTSVPGISPVGGGWIPFSEVVFDRTQHAAVTLFDGAGQSCATGAPLCYREFAEYIRQTGDRTPLIGLMEGLAQTIMSAFVHNHLPVTVYNQYRDPATGNSFLADDPQLSDLVRIQRTTVHAQRSPTIRAALNSATLAHPPSLDGVTTYEKPADFKMYLSSDRLPAVLSTSWQSANGSILILLGNWTRDTQSISLSLDRQRHALPQRPMSAVDLTQSESALPLTTTSNGLQLSVSVPAFGVRVIRIQ